MKKIVIIILIAISFGTARAQSTEAQQLLLNWEKLSQLKNMLKDMKQGYDMLQKGYNTVKDLSQGNFQLHEVFLDGLLLVSPTVKKYRKVGEIISYQVALVKESKLQLSSFRAHADFNPRFLRHIEQVYDNLLDKSLRNLDELTIVVTAGQLRMSDDERLQAIDAIHEDMEDKLLFLRSFNGDGRLQVLQWAKENSETNTLNRLYGLK